MTVDVTCYSCSRLALSHTSPTLHHVTPTEIWCLLIDHAKKYIGDASPVNISSNSGIHELKEKVKEKRPDILSGLHAGLHGMTPVFFGH